MRKVYAVIAFAFLVVSAALADVSLSGKWRGESRNKAPITLMLRVSEATLAGTFGRNDQFAEIKSGKVAANTFTFEVTMGDRTERFSGEFERDELRLWMERQGRENAIILERVKD